MTVTVEMLGRVKGTQIGSSAYQTARFGPRLEALLQFSNGTGVLQADLLFAEERTIADGGSDDLDLAGGLVDVFGATINMVELVGLIVINAPISGTANTTNLKIGGAANAFEGFLTGTTPKIGPIRPGGFVMLGCGDAAGLGTITAGTADILRIGNSSGAAATYQIALIGRSA